MEHPNVGDKTTLLYVAGNQYYYQTKQHHRVGGVPQPWV